MADPAEFAEWLTMAYVVCQYTFNKPHGLIATFALILPGSVGWNLSVPEVTPYRSCLPHATALSGLTRHGPSTLRQES
jgi:hypothetical protein